MGSEREKKNQPVSPDSHGVQRRGLLRFGTLMAAFTGASAISTLGASDALAAPGDKTPPTTYVPISEKGAPSGVATLDAASKILPAQLPDLSATYDPIGAAAEAAAPKLDSATAAATFQARGEKVRNVKDSGGVGDGVADDTAAIQAVINASAAETISSAMGVRGVVEIPAGKYKITDTITQPPYVKVVCLGTVIIESYAAAKSAWWVAPLATDPTNLYGPIGKQQWMRGNVIDGTIGGMILVNRTGSTGTTVGLELGSRTNISRVMSRYSMTDVAIQGYAVGMKLNSYNHYIASYTRLHIEMNDTNVQIGTGVGQSNSGENFSWHGCVIAGAMVGVDHNTDSFDMAFYSCSFDFLGTGFWHRTTGGWNRTLISGGHIEGINEAGRYTSTGAFVRSDVVAPNVFPDVNILGTVPYKLNERKTQFKGNMRLRLGMSYRTQDWTNMAYTDNVLCDDFVQVKTLDVSTSNGSGLISRALNLTLDPVFAAEADGTAGSALAHWTITTSSCVLTVSADGPRTSGSKSVQAVITGSGNFTAAPKEYTPCTAGNTMRVGVAYKFSGSPFPSTSVVGKFYDVNKVLIQTTSSSTYGRTNTATAQWRVFDGSARFVAPPGACYFNPTYTVGTGSGDGAQTYQFSEFYTMSF